MSTHAYNAQAAGDPITYVKFNEATVQLGRVTGTGLYPFAKGHDQPIDLSGAAAWRFLFHARVAMTLYKAIILYTEATSADAGITLEIGKESDRDYYYTGASEASKAQYYEKDVTLLATDIAAGDTVTVYSPGAKVGTGEIVVTLYFQFAV